MTMKVRLLVHWGQYEKGAIIPEMPGGQARTMIALGRAEEVKEEKRSILRSPVDRMMNKTQVIRR